MKRLLLLVAILSTSSLVQAKTIEYELDNGLKLVVREDHRAPVVVSQVWYKVGATYEHDGISGVSHVLEHMMFKGTKTLKPGEFSEIIAEHGGTENAFTSKDYTAYFQRISSQHLELCLRLEADRMRNLQLQQDEFKKELEVVKEERRLRVDNKPKSKLYEQVNATAFLSSPARIPTIGWMSDLNQLTLEDAQAWYTRWYAPNNATIVIVGDVDSDEVFALVKKYFSEYKPEKIIASKKRQEAKQTGLRQITIHDEVSTPYMMMGYKVPSLETIKDKKDAYTLEVIASILDGGNSARFSKNILRGEELAVSLGTSYDLYDRLESLFVFAGTPTKNTSLETLKKAVIKQLDNLKTSPVSQQELDTVVAHVVAEKIYDRDSMFNMGMQIGMLEATHMPWKLMEEYENNIKKVTIDDIQRVANKFFKTNDLTVGYLFPNEKGENK